MPSVELRLEGVPEMSYDPNPTSGSGTEPGMLPRGELCLRGPQVGCRAGREGGGGGSFVCGGHR